MLKSPYFSLKLPRERNKPRVQLLKRHPSLDERRLTRAVVKIVNQDAALSSKQAQILEFVDSVAAVVAAYTPCKAGCHDCCLLPTFIFEHEALKLAEASGREMAKVPLRERPESLAASRPYMGAPCPFLQFNAGSGTCSVYEVRPLICRLHHSLAPDLAECRILPVTGIRPPMLNPDYAELPYLTMMMRFAPEEPWGVIQEFFPG